MLVLFETRRSILGSDISFITPSNLYVLHLGYNSCGYYGREEVNVPVRMFWNASSTLLASNAEVSIKERLFSPRLISVNLASTMQDV